MYVVRVHVCVCERASDIYVLCGVCLVDCDSLLDCILEE